MLPNGHRAFVDVAKPGITVSTRATKTASTRRGCLLQPWGNRRRDVALLQRSLLDAAIQPATIVSETRFGAIYVVEFRVTTPAGSATIRSGWIIGHGEDFPRLVTCYVKVVQHEAFSFAGRRSSHRGSPRRGSHAQPDRNR